MITLTNQIHETEQFLGSNCELDCYQAADENVRISGQMSDGARQLEKSAHLQ
jgi:hypothetical protein